MRAHGTTVRTLVTALAPLRMRLLVAALVLPLGAAAAAAEDVPDRRVGFSVERSREVANDWVTAVLSVSHEDPKAAEVAARINRDMSWAMGLAPAACALCRAFARRSAAPSAAAPAASSMASPIPSTRQARASSRLIVPGPARKLLGPL